MPFKTRYGDHYHVTWGCHGANIPCDTNGLEPCADCCGTGGNSASLGGGVPVVTEGGERLSYENLSGLATDGIDVVLSAETLSSIEQDGDFESYLALAATNSTEVAIDDVVEVARNADGSATFRVRGEYMGTRSDYAEADESFDPASFAGRVDGLSAAEQHLSGNAAPLLDGETHDSLVAALALHLGIPSPPPSPETVRDMLSAAGISETIPAVVEGRTRAGALLVSTRHVSSASLDRSRVRGGVDWLYEQRFLHIISPDGRDLTEEVIAAQAEMEEIEADEQVLQVAVEKEAHRLANDQVPESDFSEVDREEEDALRRADEVEQHWQDEYDAWRASPETEAQAQQMAARMRENRPERRHRYIDGDVEDRLRDRYVRRNPKPDAQRMRAEARNAAARRRRNLERQRSAEVDRHRDAILASDDDSWKPESVERDGRQVTAEGVAAARRSHALRHAELRKLGFGNIIGMPLAYEEDFGSGERLSRQFVDRARRAGIELEDGDSYPMDVAGPDLRL